MVVLFNMTVSIILIVLITLLKWARWMPFVVHKLMGMKYLRLLAQLFISYNRYASMEGWNMNIYMSI